MKKFMFVLAVISAINITACSSDDDGGSETQGNSDCETCNLELLGESLTTEFCDNGDGTITVTVFGESEIEDLEQKYLVGGLSWCDAKQILFEKINRYLVDAREKYDHYITNPKLVEDILAQGAQKTRPRAIKKLKEIKDIIGM